VTTAAPRLDLTRQRTLGELLSETFALFRRHSGVFMTVALLVVAPVTLLVEGVWGRALADGPEAKAAQEVSVVAAALNALVVLPLVTAVHVLVVQAAAQGRDMDVGEALRAAGARIGPAIGTVLLYFLATFAGTLLLVIPGLWIAIRWYFGMQAVIVDDLPPMRALARSAELVKGMWWRTFGCVAAIVLIAVFLATVLTGLVAAIDSPPVYVTGLIVAQAWTLSLTATFGTLLFFDLRARKGVGAEVDGEDGADGRHDPGAWRPERPDA
jgi:hypothetical protein